MSIIDQVKQTLIEEIEVSIRKANLEKIFQKSKLKYLKILKMEIILLILLWF